MKYIAAVTNQGIFFGPFMKELIKFCERFVYIFFLVTTEVSSCLNDEITYYCMNHKIATNLYCEL